ncbi:MAG: HPF/RaiA family ribosome-associated protein [Sphingobacteriaceae bacterium]|nr:HPF/RaiA family ribosome-associated protein [Sphingobacteriaceae bacterium]
MTIKIQSVHFDADKKLLGFVNQKVEKLNTFYDGIINSEIILRLDKSNNASNKIAEIKMHGRAMSSLLRNNVLRLKRPLTKPAEALRSQVTKHKKKTKL